MIANPQKPSESTMKWLAVLAVILGTIADVALAHEVQRQISIEQYKLERVTPRIHVVHGPDGLPDAKNRGFINNPTAILTPHGVIVVDPGSSEETGRQFLKKLRALTRNPVIAVFNTHVHGDHWLGNHAIRKAYPKVPIYAHQRMINRVNAGEGEDWRKLFMGMTKGALAGTKVIGPNIGLQGGESLMLDGVALRIHYFGHAHTDHDLLIEVVEDRAMVCGDVVVVDHIPNSDVPHDADFGGSIKAIYRLLDGSATTFVPGHGRSGGREVPEMALRFLERLYALVKQYYQQGLADHEMKAHVIQGLGEYRNWVNYNELGRVISHVYLEIERDNF